ncbi:Abi family protein [Francisella philomiragia]|uniref:Abi-like family protein n=1 Tax=Francisella philomiragia TaxID=28110 RepID=A0A0B6D503_9GAMM|nr:Abi family protein [Francisella philomiragia]AJI53921.1 abi-like family protein [Francisella philomiragia]
MDTKKSIKDWKSYQEQLDILKSRGMIIDDEPKAIKYLQNINYYRLSGYWYDFLTKDRKRFNPNTKFTDAKELYVFDKKLRLLVLDAIETIEISLRANFAYIMGEINPIAYKSKKVFNLEKDVNNKYPNWKMNRFEGFKQKLEDYKRQKEDKREVFINHHIKQNKEIPIWVALEVYTLGNISKIYEIINSDIATNIARVYDIETPTTFERILTSITIIRNICSHHGRLWNRSFTFNIKGSDNLIDKNLYYGKNNLFFFILIIDFLLKKILPNSSWLNKFFECVDKCLDDTSTNISKKFIYHKMGIKLGATRQLFK